jgi:hypothetical protein
MAAAACTDAVVGALRPALEDGLSLAGGGGGGDGADTASYDGASGTTTTASSSSLGGYGATAGDGVPARLADEVYAFYGLARGATHMLGPGAAAGAGAGAGTGAGGARHTAVVPLWPDGDELAVGRAGVLLGLPLGFLSEPRNFLVLPADLAAAYRAGAAAVVPVRDRAGGGGSGDGVDVGGHRRLQVRILHASLAYAIKGATARAALAVYDGRMLAWPAARARPFTRLLAWRVLAARGDELRVPMPADHRLLDELTQDCDADAAAAVAAGGGVFEPAVDALTAARTAARGRHAAAAWKAASKTADAAARRRRAFSRP